MALPEFSLMMWGSIGLGIAGAGAAFAYAMLQQRRRARSAGGPEATRGR